MTIEGAETRPSSKKPSIGQFLGRIFFPHGKNDGITPAPAEQAITLEKAKEIVKGKFQEIQTRQAELAVASSIDQNNHPELVKQVKEGLSRLGVQLEEDSGLTVRAAFRRDEGFVGFKIREQPSEGSEGRESRFGEISVKMFHDARMRIPDPTIKTVHVGPTPVNESLVSENNEANVFFLKALADSVLTPPQPKA